eukprot:922729_1
MINIISNNYRRINVDHFLSHDSNVVRAQPSLFTPYNGQNVGHSAVSHEATDLRAQPCAQPSIFDQNLGHAAVSHEANALRGQPCAQPSIFAPYNAENVGRVTVSHEANDLRPRPSMSAPYNDENLGRVTASHEANTSRPLGYNPSHRSTNTAQSSRYAPYRNKKALKPNTRTSHDELHNTRFVYTPEAFKLFMKTVLKLNIRQCSALVLDLMDEERGDDDAFIFAGYYGNAMNEIVQKLSLDKKANDVELVDIIRNVNHGRVDECGSRVDEFNYDAVDDELNKNESDVFDCVYVEDKDTDKDADYDVADDALFETNSDALCNA